MDRSSDLADEILQLFRQRGDSQYGAETVSQLEHALQTASLALADQADATLVTAALLHDVGHLLHDLPDDAPDHGIDDHHEVAGGNWLTNNFGPEVSEPVRLHVPAKRYLCAVEQAYKEQLSAPSIRSLHLQGGPMTAQEVAEFEQNPQCQSAIKLRRWDDAAKVPGLQTEPLESFVPYITAAIQGADKTLL